MMLATPARCLALALLALPTAMAAFFHHHTAAPRGWQLVDKAAKVAGDPRLETFTIALTMQNLDQLGPKLLAVSTPGQVSYGRYMDKAAVDAAFAPSPAAVSAVTKWLKANKVSKFNVQGAFIDFAADVATANALLNATYQRYNHDGKAKLRTLSYSLPDSVAEHVAVVDPSIFFGSTQALLPPGLPSRTSPGVERRADADASKTTVDAACQTSITPKCLKQMYKVGDYAPKAKSGSFIGFGSFLNQSAIYSDVFQFEELNGIPPQNFSKELISGGVNDQDPSNGNFGEANLDAECVVGIAHPLPFVEYITGGSPPFIPNIDQPTPADNQNEPYVPYYRYLLSKSNKELPQVISNSYGEAEDSVPYNYAQLTCAMIGMMGLRGITVIESSGDVGVGSGCLAPDYKTVEFNAQFPSTCPWITSVGGTVAVEPELAWEGSSGGFSRYWRRPAYQNAAIATYMQTVSPETRRYYGQYTDFNGRGFPDLAAHSVSPNYQVVYNGQLRGSGGASAAAPVVAGIVGLLNDARLRAGRPALGFLNPLLYAFGSKVLTDITDGHSIGCDGNNTQSGGPEPPGSGIVPGAKWNATKGWDPVTGYGTPDFQKMKALVLSF